MSGWMWRDLSLKEPSRHIRVVYSLFDPILTLLGDIHCSPFGSHRDILFSSLLLLFSFCGWYCGKTGAVKVLVPSLGDLKKTKTVRRSPLSSPRTSSLHSTKSSPRSLTAMQEYFPPSKGLGLRIFRVSTPWLFCIKYFGSSPMIILFFIQIILGCRKQNKTKIYLI